MKGKATLVVELDADELAFRIAQAAIGVRAPPGTSAKEALDAMDRVPTMPGAPAMGAGFRAASLAAMEYFRDQTTKGHRTQ